MRILLFVSLLLSACVAGDDVEPEPDAARVEDGTPGYTRITLLSRFYLDGREVACADVIDDVVIEVSPLGLGQWKPTDVITCFESIHPNPERQYMTGVLAFNLPDGEVWSVRVAGSSVEHVVSISSDERDFGYAERWPAFVVDY